MMQVNEGCYLRIVLSLIVFCDGKIAHLAPTNLKMEIENQVGSSTSCKEADGGGLDELQIFYDEDIFSFVMLYMFFSLERPEEGYDDVDLAYLAKTLDISLGECRVYLDFFV